MADSAGPRRELSILRRLPRSLLLNYARAALDTCAPSAAVRRGAAQLPAWQLLAGNLSAWLTSYLRLRLGPRHAFSHYAGAAGDGIYPLEARDGAAEIRLALAGDWASLTAEAAQVAAAIGAVTPHFTIHLGDVYYLGSEAEVRASFFGEQTLRYLPTRWPRGLAGTFALNGNHEMYARGSAYFDVLLPQLGLTAGPAQRASFFCLENAHWRILALDTAYTSVGWPLLEELPLRPFAPAYDLTRAQLRWLREVVRPERDARGLIILTHHPPCSRFERGFPQTARQLARLIRRPVLWFWGHEHRLAVYEPFTIDGLEIHGRCIGHGGMPVELRPQVRDARARLAFTDARSYENSEGIEVGYNGYALLRLRGAQLGIEYRDLRGEPVWQEAWQPGDGALARRAAP